VNQENPREYKKYDPAKEQRQAEFAHSSKLWDRWQRELQRGKTPFTDTRESGKVKHFNSLKRFGFIDAATGEELFFHIDEVENCNQVERGQQLKFERINNGGRLKAVNITLVTDTEKNLQRLGL
jgi:cold shock CspA family protein